MIRVDLKILCIILLIIVKFTFDLGHDLATQVLKI